MGTLEETRSRVDGRLVDTPIWPEDEDDASNLFVRTAQTFKIGERVFLATDHRAIPSGWSRSMCSQTVYSLVFFVCFLFSLEVAAQEETRIADVAVETDPEAGDVRIKTYEYRTRGGKTGEYEVGTFYVPENRSDPNSRLISIGFSRWKAKKGATEAPIFLLPGGPGSSFQEREPGNPNLHSTPFYITALWGRSDVITVDQRGASLRGEVLTGRYEGIAPTPDSGLKHKINDAKQFAKSAVQQYRETETDLRGYTVLECIEDVNELRQALGYEKISLCGGSFGSQWSFGIMRQHPEIVERALLSGVEPLDHGYDMPSHMFAMLERTWRVINKDPLYQPYLPAGGMKEAAETVIKRLEDGIEVKKPGLPGFGEPEVVRVLGPTDFPWKEPSQILELYHGRTSRWASKRGRPRGKVKILYHLVDSSLGVTPERKQRLFDDPATRFFTTRYFEPLMAAAESWPSPDVGNELRRPVKCDIPVVFVHGDWDDRTPIENTFEIEPYFPNSHTLIVHQAGHATITRQLYAEHPQLFNRLMTFLSRGETKDLPARITIKPYRSWAPPQFQLPASTDPD